MPLDLQQFDVMAYLWDAMEKADDGNHIRYTPDDVETLWKTGFVDTEKTSLAEWCALFEPHRQADGTFLLNRASFLKLDAYRYTGEIRIPFDALDINEGQYTDQGLEELVTLSIRPSCGLAIDKLRTFVNALKKSFRNPKGLIEIRRAAKLKIKKLLDEYPSPLRNLELIFDQMLAEGLDQKMSATLTKDAAPPGVSEAERQRSSFSALPTTRSELHARQLQAMAKTKASATAAPEKETKGIELKKLRRPAKGIRS